MFGKEKSFEPELPAVSKSSAKDIKTLIGEGCKVEGNFFIPTYTRIDGTIVGDLTGDSGIVVGVHGTVEGNIVASEVINYGHIKGNVESPRVELKKGSFVDGDIAVNQFIAEVGCSFNGSCKMIEIEKPREMSSVVTEQTDSD